MIRQPLSTEFLRADGQVNLATIVPLDGTPLSRLFALLGIKAANISPDFDLFYRQNWSQGSSVYETTMNVGTMRQRMPDEWLVAFHYWAGIRLDACLGAVALQGNGEKGILLTNGKLNGCVLAEFPQYAATFRWHDPSRPYPEQTATYHNLGWSFHVVHVGSRQWCPQGGKILYT